MRIDGIRNAKVLLPDGSVTEGGLIFDGEQIAAARSEAEMNGVAGNLLDAKGCFALPGIVDPEAHLGSNVSLEQDLATESRAAAAHGITSWNLQQTSHTIFAEADERPGPELDLSFKELAPKFASIGESTAFTDFSLTPIVMTTKQTEEIPELAAEWGITTYKLYMHMRLGREQLTKAWPQAPLLGVHTFDDALVYSAMRNVATLAERGLLSMHCENWEIARFREEELKQAGRTETAAWNDRSPAALEAMHVRGYAYLAGTLGCRMQVQHVTTIETVEAVAKARAEGVNIFGQSGPHYLTLDASAAKINTPLRPAETHPALWRALADGGIDAVGSDHVCRGASREQVLNPNVWEAISGFPSRVEAHLPLMLHHGVTQGRISMQRLVEVMSSNPAKIWGLYPRKGALQPGADADVVLVDMSKTITLSDDAVMSRAGWTLYAGQRLTGWPVATVLRGNVVAEWEGATCHVESEPTGSYLRRPSA